MSEDIGSEVEQLRAERDAANKWAKAMAEENAALRQQRDDARAQRNAGNIEIQRLMEENLRLRNVLDGNYS